MTKIKKLTSNPQSNDEFVGLAGFEEIDSYKLIKEVSRYGKKKLKYEIYKDGKIKKKKKNRNASRKNQVIVNPSWNINNKTYNNKNLNSSQEEQIEQCDIYGWRAIFTPEEVIDAIKVLQFKQPTEIQKLTIPAAIKKRRDIIGAAETGSGKTLAFGIPIINGILRKRERQDRRLEKDNEEIVGNDIKMDEESDESEIDEYNDSNIDENNDSTLDENNEKFADSKMDENNEEYDDSLLDENNEFGCVKVIDNANFDLFSSHLNETTEKAINNKKFDALIITPTRELAIQIKKHLDAVLTKTTIQTAVIIGGMSQEKQERVLSEEPEIVIGTPGRLWEMIQQGNEYLANVSNIRYLVIDETDRMLEKGHFEELKQLLELINGDEIAKKKRQNFIFSATLTMTCAPPKRLIAKKKKVQKLTSEIKLENLIKLAGLRDKPKIVDITSKTGTAELLSEAKITCEKNEKDDYLYYFITKFPGRTLIFCNSINCVNRLANLLNILQCHPQALHASKQQKQRLKSLERFASNGQSILIATDVAARGIDIAGVDHIIHYEIPRTAETYIHRSGRTARANKEGLSVLLIESGEVVKYRALCSTLNRESDITSLTIERDILNQVRRRVQVARDIEKAEYGIKKQKNDQSWIQKMAIDSELQIGEANMDDDDDVAEIAVKKKMALIEIKNKKAHLCALLSKPILPATFSARYPTILGGICKGKNEESSAIHLAKQRNKTNDSLLTLKAKNKRKFKPKKKLKNKIKI